MGKAAKRLSSDTAFEAYTSELKSKFKFKEAREHAYRPALQQFIESMENGIEGINDAARIKCGAPDFIVYKKRVPVGYIEAKDINKDLSKEEKSEQIRGYHSLGNLILTDYLNFRWFVDGEVRLTVSIGETKGSNIIIAPDAEDKLLNLFSNFLAAETKTIQTASELAQRLAVTTTSIRDLIVRAFDLEEKTTGWLHKWLKAFSEVLIADLDKKTFADMFAQTLAYGFFAARVHHTDKIEFSRFSAAKILPRTNPFLRKLFAQFAGVDMPETISWAVDEVVEILKRADMTKVLSEFGKQEGKEDPVVHFYETFLAAYDPKLRESRGVYYTPSQVVDYIVKSVDGILIKSFSKEKGLADDKTLILDPAVGTASFLHNVVARIYSKFTKNKGAWDSYVATNLLDRVFGFEILMAPYSVAHLKLGIQLQETGYRFQGTQRLGVYLTNTLEEAAKKSQQLLFEWVSEEANSAATLKRDKPIMVVLGNPPYSGNSMNKGEWITNLLRGYDSITDTKTDNYFECDGKPLGERNPRYLSDDYVKFIRFAQWRIKQTGHGVLAFITNHGFLDNPTFRGMRRSLMTSFDELYLLDLHGNSKKGDAGSDNKKDENVFDIQQGVSIFFFVRKHGSEGDREAEVFKADVWGSREDKYSWLSKNDLSSTKWKKINPVQPFYLFDGTSVSNKSSQGYLMNPTLTDIFEFCTPGFKTHRDHFAIDRDKKVIVARIAELRDSAVTNSDVSEKYELKDTGSWNLQDARKNLRQDDDWKDKITLCAFRPFDDQWGYYDKSIMDRPRAELIDHVFQKENICIISARQQAVAGYNHSWITRRPANDCLLSTKTKEADHVFPLFVFEKEDLLNRNKSKKRLNIKAHVIEALEEAYGFSFTDEKLKEFKDPQHIAFYIYGILNSKKYRSDFAHMLKSDFPRIPFVADKKVFLKTSELGERLANLHMMEGKNIQEADISFPESGENKIEKIRFDKKAMRLFINATQFFEGIDSDLFEFKIGSYEILEKWLKDRPDRELSYEGIKAFKKIAFVLKETMKVQTQIDEELSASGWPIASINISKPDSVNELKTRVLKKAKATLEKASKKSSRKQA